ncbi:MAG: di-trans,poly-cis-decaprenylcistransferase [Caldisericia bacterium]|nr:di-trans,poly-cis-decaprenylcistransferase [Caldisericia bacterium]
MDGNGRWAKKKGLARIEGHRSARTAIRESISAAQDVGVKYLSLFAFSTENWTRPDAEISMLFSIFTEFLIQETTELNQKGVRIFTSGHLEKFPNRMKKELKKSTELTENNSDLHLNICLDYSGRNDILCAVKKIVNEKLSSENITELTIENHLLTENCPSVDLLIRTSGEKRISNFMLWQIAYAELYFDTTYFPDYRKENFFNAIKDFNIRDRRFGNVK